MEIQSPAGQFSFDIEHMDAEGDALILKGKMGVWEAQSFPRRDDLLKLVGLALRNPAVWMLALKLPLYALRGTPKVKDP